MAKKAATAVRRLVRITVMVRHDQVGYMDDRDVPIRGRSDFVRRGIDLLILYERHVKRLNPIDNLREVLSYAVKNFANRNAKNRNSWPAVGADPLPDDDAGTPVEGQPAEHVENPGGPVLSFALPEPPVS